MKYNTYEKDGKVIIENVKDFEPKHIFECGQCFRWNDEGDGSFTGVAFGKVVNIKKEEDNIIISNTNIKEFEDIWYDYLDLGRNYGEVKEKLSNDPILKEAIKFGEGIRILRQDEWEILISFIISANNRIPMIKKAIDILSEKYGEFIGEFNGKKYYAFPTPENLKDASIEDIENCKTGFRAKYISAAINRVLDKEIDIYKLENLSTEEAREELMTFSGVGPKVSDCIMLFSMGKADAFPIDVWVKRIMEHFYLEEDTKLNDIQKYAGDKFRELAGFAQQYLFYYARELGIGKKK
ncbi:8-oxoguanine DNA glycosylase [Gottschalkia acidurici 9a]|uniref:DNA-(apurinic or apyrimidinic site) lyase n=1 Tax=Gottschalkia acidurici (strain ATCC 7906 / DSM 604 / BCRC 14475 / CIP 104303 / KCTC 5404 / NCIMB 10678 / 9a) TaxID=1128398 RepID=K0AVR0_GOTA9|nr:DNA glycosylase [Gottschalkia acidurici]AFS77364.1 8-oxoguanine DNA glycosylase [Gottschalkia acidurici 9a]